MSCWGDLKDIFRSIATWSSVGRIKVVEQLEQVANREVDVTDRDAVVTARAKRNYELVYPPKRSLLASIGPLFNRHKFNRYGIVSVFTHLLNVTSSVAILFLFMVVLFIFAGGAVVIEGSIETILATTYFASFLGVAGLMAGEKLREYDKESTMQKCIDNARVELEDSQALYQEVCLIMIEQEITANCQKIARYNLEINGLVDNVKRVTAVSQNIESIPSLSRAQKNADVEEHCRIMRPWKARIRYLRKKMKYLNKRSVALQSEILRIQASAPLIELNGELARLNSGQLDEEIRQLDESADERLLKARNKVRRLSDNLSKDVGLLPNASDVPKLIE